MVSNRCRVVLRAFFLFVTLLAKHFKVLIEFYAEASITVVMHMESGAVHPSVLIIVHPTTIAESVFLQVGASPPAPFLAVDVLVIIHRAVEIAPEFVHWSGTQTAILHLCASSLPNHCLTTFPAIRGTFGCYDLNRQRVFNKLRAINTHLPKGRSSGTLNARYAFRELAEESIGAGQNPSGL